MVRILGLDPGSRVCGYGVIDEHAGELRYVECGVLTAPEDRAMEDRLGELARGLKEVIAELAPAVVAIEDVFSHQNVRSALALAQARGMALAVVGLSGLAKVQVWTAPAGESWPADDPYFTKAPWKDAEILPAPSAWGGDFPDGKLPDSEKR